MAVSIRFAFCVFLVEISSLSLSPCCCVSLIPFCCGGTSLSISGHVCCVTSRDVVIWLRSCRRDAGLANNLVVGAAWMSLVSLSHHVWCDLAAVVVAVMIARRRLVMPVL